MTESTETQPRFLAELKRRKVVRAALVYGAAAFAVLQVADIVVEPLGLPAWAMTMLVWLALLGLPVTLVVSWFVDVSRDAERTKRWFSLRAAAAFVVLVAIGIAGWVFRPGEARPVASAVPAGSDNTVVVLPFTVLGSDETAYLSDAVAKLLNTSLDGTAGLRTVSPHALMGYPDLQPGVAPTESQAREIAEYFGAGLWLVGDVLQAGDSLRIEATLVNRLDPSAGRVTANVTAGMDDLFASVDQLSTLLLAEREAGAGSARTRTAALTTSSIDALKAYIEGERAFRAGSYLPAVDAFTRAVQADTTFALAFYRLSMTEERLAWAEASRLSAEAAWRHSSRLSPREREFLEAVVALRRGNTSEAEQLLRGYVRVHADDPEAWYQLGEILFHGEPLRGGSMTAAREPLEAALYYDPRDLGALYHLVRIAIRDGDVARLDTLTARFVALSPTGERTLELRALEATSRSDTASFRAILDEMSGSPDSFLPIAVWSVAAFGQDPTAAASIARIMTGRDRPADIRSAGHVQLAHLALAGGRWTDAAAQLDTAMTMGDPDAAESRGWLAALPFIQTGDTELEDLRAMLRARLEEPPATSSRPSSFYSAQNGVHEPVNLYVQGLIAVRRGDPAEASRLAGVLESTSGTEGARELGRQLAAGLRAQSALAAGDSVTALQLLSDLRIEGWYELTFVSPYWSGALERFMLAELLLAAGRAEEALGWYQGLRENSVAELVFAGPALLREAAIHRQAGRTQQAQRLEARFEQTWANADSELRAAVRARYGSAEVVTDSQQ